MTMTNKKYLENSYLTEYEGKILLNRQVDDKFHLLLDKTIFYPDGLGGQKGDIGTINGINVEYSFEKEDKIYHVTSEKVPGSEGLILINWENRLKIMQQHTTQHLVSQCFKKLYNIDTLGFHASKDFISIDLNIDSISQEQIENVEELANSVIQNNLEVKTYFPDEKELELIDFRREPKVNHDLRVVEIETFDFAACGGTHVKKTGELGLIKIIDTSRVNKNTRITVVSGQLALKDYNTKNEIITKINYELSANTDNILDKFSSLVEQNNNLKENYSKLKKEYYFLLKKNIMLNNENKKIVIYDFSKFPFEDAQLLSKEFEDENVILAIYNNQNLNIIPLLVKVCGNLDISLKEFNNALKNKLNFKGGGKDHLIQGVIVNSKDSNIEEFLYSQLKNYI